MNFNVSGLLREPNGSNRSYDIDEPVALTGDKQRCPVSGSVKLLRTDKGIWVSASFDCNLARSCNRCLTDITVPIHMDVEEEFLPVFDIVTGTRLHTPEAADEDFYIDQNHVLDLTEALRQYADISTPIKSVCRENCLGICVNCGVDLNESACLCETAFVDPKWNALLEAVSAPEGE